MTDAGVPSHIHVGAAIPHSQFPPGEPPPNFPIGLWELHTVESWATAVLQEALDVSSRPDMPPPGQDIQPVQVGLRTHQSNVQFTVMGLPDGSVGVAATFERFAGNGITYFNHHMVKLPVTASPEPPETEKPDTDRP